MKYYLYILYSTSLDRFYVGYSSDVELRIRKHMSKHKGYTSRAKDWKLVYQESYESKSEAYGRERELKSWKSRKKLEELVRKK